MTGTALAAASVATSVAMFLIALAVALAFLYFGLRWVSKNEDQTRAALSKVGITAPDPPADGPDPIDPPPAPVIAAPPQPIVLTPVVPTGSWRLVDMNGTSFDLVDGANLVSRESGQIVIAGDPTVSRRHAEVVRSGSVISVRDLGSTNGTFVNGNRVLTEQSLQPGDLVRFGAASMRLES